MQDAPPTPAVLMGVPRWGPSCANIFSAKRYTRWEFRPPARWQRLHWRARLPGDPLARSHPDTRGREPRSGRNARNHRVEQALSAAVEREDFAPFSELLLVLSRPYEEQDAYQAYASPAKPDERVFRTFCGT